VVREALTALGHDLSVQWIVGNHDKELPAGLTGSVAVAYEGCGVRGVHSIETIPVTPTIIGHYHPKVAVTSHGKRLWRPCFAYTENVMILPSYGAFTGGLSIKDKAFQRILGGKPSLIALGEVRAYPLRLDAVT
jgi:metallophosphoesterase superfamily enzyme